MQLASRVRFSLVSWLALSVAGCGAAQTPRSADLSPSLPPDLAGGGADDGGQGGLSDGGVGDLSTGANDGGVSGDLSSGGTGDLGGGPYRHTITIDGVNDFNASEKLATSTAGYSAYLSWDATSLYLGLEGADVQSQAAATKWWIVYLDGANGSPSGSPYNTQQPTLPFDARWHVRWKTTNDYTNAQQFTSAAWTDAGWTFTGNIFRSGDFVEQRIPLSQLGSPSKLKLVTAVLNEQGMGEATYAACPSSTLTDGYDPNFAKYLEIDLSSPSPPSALVPKP
jgi:hypothetical protein